MVEQCLSSVLKRYEFYAKTVPEFERSMYLQVLYYLFSKSVLM